MTVEAVFYLTLELEHFTRVLACSEQESLWKRELLQEKASLAVQIGRIRQYCEVFWQQQGVLKPVGNQQATYQLTFSRMAGLGVDLEFGWQTGFS